MQQPCSNCPFKKEVKFPLENERVREIVNSLNHNQSFPCHKTVNYDFDEPDTSKSQTCFGSALFLENTLEGGCRANLAYRFALKFGHFQIEDLRKDDSIYASLDEMIQGCCR